MSSQTNQQQVSQLATREAYGKRLMELGETHPEIVVLDADLSGSTKTNGFAKKFPNRFFNVGVAEQNLMGTAAGLAQSGFTVFASTFAIFAAGRAFEMVRQSIVYPKLNVKVCPTHAGITVGEDGASHQTIEDLALMRVLPGMRVLVPADAEQTRAMVDYLVSTPGPMFLRLGRAACDPVFGPEYHFDPDKADVLMQGSDVCLCATGFVTRAALDAAQILKGQGVSCSVVCFGSLKPIDEDTVVAMAKTHKHLFSVEEHSVIGGLGAAIADVLTNKYPVRLHRLGLQDEFGQSAPYKTLLKHYKLDAQGIVGSVREKIAGN